MHIISLNKNRGIVLSWFLYILGTALGFLINYLIIQSYSFDLDLLIILMFITIFIVHELTHFIGYKVICRINSFDLKFAKDRRLDIPYTRTMVPIDKDKLFIVLILPGIITSLMILLANVITGNVAYSFLLGISLAMSGADLDVAIQLKKKQQQLWKSIDNNFGFISESN